MLELASMRMSAISATALIALPVFAMVVSADTRRETDGLPRRGFWGWSLADAEGGGVEVRAVRPGSAAALAELAPGDRIAAVDGETVTSRAQLRAMTARRRGGERVRLGVSRAGRPRSAAVTLPALPLESIAGADVRYGSVTTPGGYRVRTIVTRPHGASGRLPAIVFIPWLSDDPVERPFGPDDGWSHMLHRIAAESGWVLYRVEKPGVADSEGPEPSRNDLEADLAAYRAALDDAARLPFVDPERIVVMGGSLGGALAPILAGERRVAGVIAVATFSRTWFEHMLAIERQRLTLSGGSPAEVNRALRGFAELYALYLGERLTPEQALERKPHLRPLWYDAPDGQYGRPAAFYHQVAALNVEEAWSRIDVPTLVLHGDYDWIMGIEEGQRIVEIVNERHPGLAELALLRGADHGLRVYASARDAFHDRGGKDDDAPAMRVIEWLERRFASRTSGQAVGEAAAPEARTR